MPYAVKFWRTIGARQENVTLANRPGCPGSFLSNRPGCPNRPAHVVTWMVNKSGLPDSGRPQVHLACHRHLHGVISHGESQSLHVTVSAYRGV